MVRGVWKGVPNRFPQPKGQCVGTWHLLSGQELNRPSAHRACQGHGSLLSAGQAKRGTTLLGGALALDST